MIKMDESDKNGKIMGGVNWAQISPHQSKCVCTTTRNKSQLHLQSELIMVCLEVFLSRTEYPMPGIIITNQISHADRDQPRICPVLIIIFG